VQQLRKGKYKGQLRRQTQTTTVTPPLFQGIVVDAKGKTVGRIYINAALSFTSFYGTTAAVHLIIRQINGV
jgi:hypothetical protein